MHIDAFGAFVIVLSNFLFWVFTFTERPGQIAKAYFWWSFFITLWALGYGFTLAGFFDYEKTLVWNRCCQAMATLIGPFFFRFACQVVGKSKKYQKVFRIYLCIAIVNAILLLATPLYVKGLWSFGDYRYQPLGGPLYPIFTVIFVGCTVHSYIVVLTNYRHMSGIKQKQVGLFLLATGIAYFGGGTLFLQAYGLQIPTHGVYLILAYVIIIGYSVHKYHFLDMGMAVTKTSIFILLYAFIFGLPLFFLFPARSYLMLYLESSWWILPASLYAVLSLFGPFLYLLFERKVENRLLREQQRYQHTLMEASRGMTLIKKLEHLLNLMVHILTRTIRIEHAVIYLIHEDRKKYFCGASRGIKDRDLKREVSSKDKLIHHLEKYQQPVLTDALLYEGPYAPESEETQLLEELHAMKASVIVPSLVKDKLIGFVNLGRKKSGREFTQADLDTLSILSNQSALAIENCRFILESETQQAQLFQAAKMADLGTMASGIGHQINNRLNVIRIGADRSIMLELRKIKKILEDEGLEEGLKQALTMEDTLRKIADNSARGGEIVRRLLDFSRLSEGFNEVDMVDAIESCVRLWECKRNLTEVHFKKDLAVNLPSVRGNYSQIEEVIFNLLDNAFDAIKMKEEAWGTGELPQPETAPKGTIHLTADDTMRNNKKWFRLRVSDSGLGMSRETQHKLFVPFFTTKATGIKGTGLGLYVIKRMIDAHHGEVTVTSKYGKGTTFTALLPIFTGSSEGVKGS